MFLLLLTVAGQADETVSNRIRLNVEQIAAGERLELAGSPIASVIVLPALYQKYAYRPIWHNPESVRQLEAAIDTIQLEGLNPADYHGEVIRQLRQAQAVHFDQAREAELDILLTDSLVRLGYHLLIGKVDPEALDSHWNMSRRLPGLDPVLALSEAIDSGRVTEFIDSFRPQAPAYRNLMTALAHYRDIHAQGGWPRIQDGATLKPGMNDARVGLLRKRLHISGDMPAKDPDSRLFDSNVEAGVRRFQKRHGLDEDGVVGKGTMAALNVPVEERIDQIRVNLERARWILHELPTEFVVADIAGFYVTYFRDGEVIWKGRAQVGKPYRKTPVFRDRIRYLEFNPTWTVPPTILKKDILPAIKRNPGYLASKNMRVLDGQGKPVDTATLDWSQYPGKSFPYMIRQEPGPDNALGRVKFMFPNKHLVYLHDTPSKSLFERSGRAFSSGCIRIENPFDFAERLLENTPGWDRDRIMREVDKAQTSRVNLAEPVTVMLLYWTVAVDAAGSVNFKPDIYQRDAAVLERLNGRFELRKTPVSSDTAAE